MTATVLTSSLQCKQMGQTSSPLRHLLWLCLAPTTPLLQVLEQKVSSCRARASPAPVRQQAAVVVMMMPGLQLPTPTLLLLVLVLQ